MAVWQFKFSAVPSVGVIRVHGERPICLPQYMPRTDCDGPVDFEVEYPNYWEGLLPLSRDRIDELEQMLGSMPSWSNDAIMFGSRSNNRVEVWSDDFNVFVDVGGDYSDFVRRIVEYCADLGCWIVIHETGQVVDPDFNIVMELLRKSSAARFCANPGRFLREEVGK